jgi:hypothetical protein
LLAGAVPAGPFILMLSSFSHCRFSSNSKLNLDTDTNFKNFLSRLPNSKSRPNFVKKKYQIYKSEYGDPAARVVGETTLKTVNGLKNFFISVRGTQIEFLFLNENYYLGLLEAHDF